MSFFGGRGGSGRGSFTGDRSFRGQGDHYSGPSRGDGGDGFNSARDGGIGGNGSFGGRGGSRNDSVSFRPRGGSRGGYRGNDRGTDRGRGENFMTDDDSNGRGRGGPYSRAPPPSELPPFNGSIEQVQISNLPPDTGAPGLIAWLLRKVSNPVDILQTSEIQNNTIVMTTSNALQAQTLVKLSGINFLKFKILIVQGGGAGGQSSSSRVNFQDSGSRPRTSVIEAFRALIQARYNPQMIFLDMENIISDPILHSAGIRSFEPESKMGGVICKMIGELCPDVQTISFASNRISSLSHFASLSQWVPKVTALSFQNNSLRSFRDLEPIKGSEFHSLRELLLAGNPLCAKEMAKAGGAIVYRSDVKKMFPSIEILDLEPIIGDITFAIDPAAASLPLKPQPGFFDSPATEATAVDFVQKFFTSFDHNRQALSDLYHDAAAFSLVAIRTSSSQYQDRWRNFNRNLDTTKDNEKRINLLQRGASKIMEVFSKIPRTSHALEPKNKMLIEGYQTGAGADATLFIMVHGEFKEDARTNRSFDRTFMIIPASPGSRAANAGLPYTVINDQLTVRNFTSKPAWLQLGEDAQCSSASNTAQGPAAGGPPPAPQLPDLATLRNLQMQHGLDDTRQHQVIEFSKVTGLNYSYSLQCLSETGWSMNDAMQAYQNVKANIPPEAYRV
ncbi:hypothetical protein DFS34DRAFT_618521 [Phlyctochytrium arcticum]|nr:hypothetical protein DFS34DRAFT_618521 [Phlyctochytrium arcticum]